jgi:hypothetical protein
MNLYHNKLIIWFWTNKKKTPWWEHSHSTEKFVTLHQHSKQLHEVIRHSWKVDSYLAGQKIPWLLQILKVHYFAHNSLFWARSISSRRSHFIYVMLSDICILVSRVVSSLKTSYQYFVCSSHLSMQASHMSLPELITHIMYHYRVQIMKLLKM